MLEIGNKCEDAEPYSSNPVFRLLRWLSGTLRFRTTTSKAFRTWNCISTPSVLRLRPGKLIIFKSGQTRSAAFLLGMGSDRSPGRSNSVSSRVASHRLAALAITGSQELGATTTRASCNGLTRSLRVCLLADPGINFHSISSIVPVTGAQPRTDGDR